MKKSLLVILNSDEVKKRIRKMFILLAVLLNMHIYASESVPRFTDDQFESFGQLHNKHLEVLLRKAINNEIDITNATSINSFLYQYQIPEISNIYGNVQIKKESVVLNSILINNAQDKLHQIFLNSVTLGEINSKIDVEINELKNNSSLTNIDYNLTLTMYYTAKYSSEFWLSKDEGGSGLGQKLQQELYNKYPSLNISGNNDPETKKSNKEIAEADAVGAAVGGLGWCVKAAITGAGTVPAFVGGLVWGAVSSSFKAYALGISNHEVCANHEPVTPNINSQDWDWEYNQYLRSIIFEMICCRQHQFKFSYCDKYEQYLKGN